MRRTEVVKKMMDCYRSCKIMRYSDEQAMDYVLKILEEMGIQPPPRERTEEEKKKPHRYDAIDLSKYIRAWGNE